MEDYPSNSHRTRKSTRPEKKAPVAKKEVKAVVTGPVTRRKKSLGKRFMETFVGGEDAQSVFSYLTFDVIIPATKEMVTDAISQGVERMLFGEVRSHRGSRGRSVGHTNYNRIYRPDPRKEEPRREFSRRARAVHDFEEFIFDTKVEAMTVLDGLYTIISEYDMVTVADLYDLSGESGNFTEVKWGWTDLRGAGIVAVRGGYLLDLPRPEVLD